MMYSRMSPVRPIPFTNNGLSFAKALGWTDVCTSGTGPANVAVGFDDGTWTPINTYYAVALTASTEYTFSGTGPYSKPKFDLYNMAGTKVAYNTGQWLEEEPWYDMPALVYTPSTTAVYILMVSNGSEMGEGAETYAVSISPRPATYTREGFTPYGTSYGFDGQGRMVRYRSAVDAGLAVTRFSSKRAWLLLHMDGNLSDSGMNGRTDITTNGEWTIEGKFGGALWSDARTTTIPYTENPFYGDFTVQCWVKIADTGRMAVMALDTDQYIGIDNYAGTWNMWAGDGTWGNILQADTDDSDPTGNSGRGTIAHQPGVWTHLAFVHHGNEWILFVNGQESRRKTRTGKIAYTDKDIRLGIWGGNVFTANYIIDEFRIDKTALWTEAFTPPAEPYR